MLGDGIKRDLSKLGKVCSAGEILPELAVCVLADSGYLGELFVLSDFTRPSYVWDRRHCALVRLSTGPNPVTAAVAVARSFASAPKSVRRSTRVLTVDAVRLPLTISPY